MLDRQTRERRRIAWMGALVTLGLLLIQSSMAEAQFPTGNSGDTTPNARPGSTGSTAILQRDRSGGMDARMLLGHAIEMVIDGSNLQLLSMQPGVPGVANPGNTPTTTVPRAGNAAGRATNPTTGPVPGPVVGSPPVTLPVPAPGVGSPGTGFTGTPGETVSGRPVTPGTGAIAPVVPGVVTGPATVVETVRINAPASALQVQAQRSIDAADRLLKRIGGEPALDQRLFRAATVYASTLRNLLGRPAERVDGTGTVIGSGVAGTPAPGSNLATVTPPVVLNGIDRASIAMINHAVMEALDSMRIKQAVQLLGSVDSPAAQILLTHAREMDAQSSTTNLAIDASGGGLQTGTVQALAQQAKELIMAMQGTVGEGNAPGR